MDMNDSFSGVRHWESDTARLPGLPRPISGLDPARANVARVYDYWLGGRSNFGVDRRAGDAIRELAPWIIHGVRANRRFLGRAVAFLARTGIDQFLDVGAGLPTMENVHEIAQRVNPRSRVVYVDNDPVVLTHARALLAVDDLTRVAAGDLRDPVGILDNPIVREHLDWTRPVAILLIAVLHFLSDGDNPEGVITEFGFGVAPGSYLAVSHVTPGSPALHTGMSDAVQKYNKTTGPFTPRTPQQVRELIGGWELVPPGLVTVSEWHEAPEQWELSQRSGRALEPEVPMVAGVARLPGESG